MTATRIQAQIDAVTVYREGARVRRVCEVTRDGDGYPAVLYLTGLPLAMSDGSVRVSVEPDGEGAAPVAASVRVVLDVPDGDDGLPPPVDEELEAARKAVRLLSGRISQVKRELSRMERLVIASRPKGGVGPESDHPPPPSPTAARISLLELRERRERALRGELAELDRELRDAELEAKRLEARHSQATTARQVSEHELRKALVIALRPGGDAAPRARLAIEYMVPGARWAPAYSIRITPDQRALFSMRALVAQQTGEDWRGVALTLSTADAQGWTELPRLAGMRIGRRQPAPVTTGWRQLPGDTEELFRDYDRALGRREALAGLPDAASQWDDETREITVPTRRSPTSPGVKTAYSEGGDFDEVTMPYGVAPLPKEQESAPAAAPAPAMFSLGGSAPTPPEARGRKATKKEAADEPPAMEAEEITASRASAGGRAGTAPIARDRARREEPGEPPAVMASADLLAYSDLRMPPPGAEQRGALRPARPTEIYLERLRERQMDISFNVPAVLAIAGRRAEAVTRLGLPPRYRVISSDRYDYAYPSDTPVDVPSDGVFHSIALVSRQADVAMRYVVVPREAAEAFRVAEVDNPLSAPILDGPVDVYLGRDFLLTSDVAFTPPGGTMRLGLGVEQAVKVARNTSYREESSGLMRGTLLCRHQIRIDVHNHLDRAIDCEVRERVPTAREGDGDIEVSVERVEPAWKRYEPGPAHSPEAGLKGGYAWTVRLDGSGGRARLEADYVIKIPAKYELVGGNRREA